MTDEYWADLGRRTMKPPFKYYGGKQRMAPKIVPLIPPHCSYVEPFAGSAAVMFAKGLPPHQTNGDHYREVINDLRGDVVAFWRVLQEPAKNEELRHMLRHTLYSRDEFYRARNVLSDPKSTEFQRAWAFFVGQYQGFSGAGCGHGWGRGSKVGPNQPITYKNAVDRLDHYVERMRGVYVDSIDAIECIQKRDRPEAFFYVDPPYVGSDQDPYSGYTEADLSRLVEALQNAKGSFILSGYEHPIIDAMGWNRIDHSAYSSAQRNASRENGKRTECLWIVDRSEAMPEKEADIARRIWGA